jgi:hypothetical protein
MVGGDIGDAVLAVDDGVADLSGTGFVLDAGAKNSSHIEGPVLTPVLPDATGGAGVELESELKSRPPNRSMSDDLEGWGCVAILATNLLLDADCEVLLE